MGDQVKVAWIEVAAYVIRSHSITLEAECTA